METYRTTQLPNKATTKKVIFYRQPIFKVCSFELLKNLWAGQFGMLSKTHSVVRHYETLQFAYRWKYFQIVKAKGQENL